MTIAIRIEPDDQTVDPGREAVFTVHVVNQSGVVDRVALDVLGPAGGWARLDPPAVALFPGTDATATVVIAPPLGTPLGPVPFGIRATAETSGFAEVGEANLNVGASRSVEAELRPRTATGKRRATSVVVLHNLGNAPTKVQVVATDPDDAIVFDAPSSVQIGPGMTAEMPLRMRLPSREKQGATLPYQVLVEGGDTGQSLDGQVRQPAKKRWPVLALLMLVALAAAAFLLLKPQDAVAIKDGKADEPTTTTLPGATTTVVGDTTVPGAAGPADPAAPSAATTAAPAPKGVGGPATTPAPGPTTTPAPLVPGPGPGPGPRPTQGTTTTRASLPCVAKGAPKETAQRVVCAWGLGRLGDVTDSATLPVLQKLRATPPIPGQTALADQGGTVTFDRCTPGKGVQSMVVASTGVDAGKVTAANICAA